MHKMHTMNVKPSLYVVGERDFYFIAKKEAIDLYDCIKLDADYDIDIVAILSEGGERIVAYRSSKSRQ